MNLFGQSIRKTKQKNKLNLLVADTHETFQTNMCLTGHNFYSLSNPIWKSWNSCFRPVPKNYFILKDGKIPEELDIDIILSQQKVGQWQYFYPLSRQFSTPLIQVEHTAPAPWYTKKDMKINKEMCGDINVFITDWSKNAWGWQPEEGITIEHGIDTELYKPNENINKKPYILSVCNQFSKEVRHWCCGFPIWKEVVKGLPWRHVGDDPGFSLPAKNLDELILEYQTAQIFINTSTASPVPMSLLEAASIGCAIISTSTSDIPNIFTHNVNALLSNDPAELHSFCIYLLKNPTERVRLGQAARQLIIERFPISKFVDSWNKVFWGAVNPT